MQTAKKKKKGNTKLILNIIFVQNCIDIICMNWSSDDDRKITRLVCANVLYSSLFSFWGGRGGSVSFSHISQSLGTVEAMIVCGLG